MLGCYDFCGYYEMTFQWLEDEGGPALLDSYWEEAISTDSQRHARDLILGEGFAGMLQYWGKTLAEESPEKGYTILDGGNHVRFDMHECPSKGFLIRNGLVQYRDYCDHCMGWIGGVMKDAGCVINHEHNHAGQCWWEFHRADTPARPRDPGEENPFDVRLLPGWQTGEIDRYEQALSHRDKTGSSTAAGGH